MRRHEIERELISEDINESAKSENKVSIAGLFIGIGKYKKRYQEEGFTVSPNFFYDEILKKLGYINYVDYRDIKAAREAGCDVFFIKENKHSYIDSYRYAVQNSNRTETLRGERETLKYRLVDKSNKILWDFSITVYVSPYGFEGERFYDAPQSMVSALVKSKLENAFEKKMKAEISNIPINWAVGEIN